MDHQKSPNFRIECRLASDRIEPKLLLRINRRRVLEALQRQGPLSRADLARQSGISAPTISKVVGSLLEDELLEEDEAGPTTRGRPGATLRLSNRCVQILGVVIDATRCWVVAAGLDGVLHEERMRSFLTPGAYAPLIERVVDGANDLMRRSGVRTLGIGISMPGLVDRAGKQIFSSNLHQTDGQMPGRDLAAALGVPAIVRQKSHALCLAERFYGDAKDLDDFAMLDVSTGLGLGVYSGGRLLKGHDGFASEFGHITIDPLGPLCGCGNRGCLETVATDFALAARISQKIGRDVTIDDAIELLRSGEPTSSDALKETSEYLAIAASAVINIFNPSTLFIHGRLFEAHESQFELVREIIRRRTLGPVLASCRIIHARGSKRLGAVASIAHHLWEEISPSF